MNKVALIILDWNGAEDTIECLESLTPESIYDIFLVDNGSTEKNRKKLEEYLAGSKYKDVYGLYDKAGFATSDKLLRYIDMGNNYGFAGGNNYVARRIMWDYPYIMLLNNDTVVLGDVIEKMHDLIERESDMVSVTCDIRRYADRSELWNAGGNFTWYGDRLYFPQKEIDEKIRSGEEFICADFVTGCALMVKSVYVRAHGLFTDRFFHGEEDFNFCRNVKKNGHKNGVYLQGTILHKVGRSIEGTKNKIRERNSTILHYTNRVIDFKQFYDERKWKAWRRVYLSMVVYSRKRNGYDLKETFSIVKTVEKLSDRFDGVDKRLFERIMSLK